MNAYKSNYSYAINGDIRIYVQFFRTSATFLPVIFKNADLNASYNIVQYETIIANEPRSESTGLSAESILTCTS